MKKTKKVEYYQYSQDVFYKKEFIKIRYETKPLESIKPYCDLLTELKLHNKKDSNSMSSIYSNLTNDYKDISSSSS